MYIVLVIWRRMTTRLESLLASSRKAHWLAYQKPLHQFKCSIEHSPNISPQTMTNTIAHVVGLGKFLFQSFYVYCKLSIHHYLPLFLPFLQLNSYCIIIQYTALITFWIIIVNITSVDWHICHIQLQYLSSNLQLLFLPQSILIGCHLWCSLISTLYFLFLHCSIFLFCWMLALYVPWEYMYRGFIVKYSIA